MVVTGDRLLYLGLLWRLRFHMVQPNTLGGEQETEITLHECYLAKLLWLSVHNIMGFPGGSLAKNTPVNAGDLGSIAGLGRSLGEGNVLEMFQATHSSILAWKIPWTGKPGELQSMESQRVGHDWVTDHACMQAGITSYKYETVLHQWTRNKSKLCENKGWQKLKKRHDHTLHPVRMLF